MIQLTSLADIVALGGFNPNKYLSPQPLPFGAPQPFSSQFSYQQSFVPPHIHPTQDEYIQVLSGELDLLLDGKRYRAQVGDLVRMPRGLPHAIFNNSGADATALFWVTPTGKLVDLFRKIHNMAHPGEVTSLSPDFEVEFLPPVRAADQL